MDYLKTSKLNKEMYFLMSSYFVLFAVCMIFYHAWLWISNILKWLEQSTPYLKLSKSMGRSYSTIMTADLTEVDPKQQSKHSKSAQPLRTVQEQLLLRILLLPNRSKEIPS